MLFVMNQGRRHRIEKAIDMGGMIMAEEKHRLILDERKDLAISGVRDVAGFTEEKIQLDSILGAIDIHGQGLKISSFNLEDGRISISGHVDGITYSQHREEKSLKQKGRSVMARLLK